MPRLMVLLDRHRIAVTFFITGDTSQRCPELVASIPTSAMRLPAVIRNPILRRLASPVVLFVHP